MYKEINEVMKNISVVSDDANEIKLILPKGIDAERYAAYIKDLLNFIESNCLTIDAAKKLFQDGIDILKYHQCAFGDAEIPSSIYTTDPSVRLLKHCMYKEYSLSSVEFVNRYGLYYAPSGLSQEAYFEMLMQLDDFIKENGLTVKQAQNLFSDCIKMLLQSK